MNTDLLIHEGQSEEERHILVEALSQAGDRKVAKVMSQSVGLSRHAATGRAEANAAHVRLLVFNHMGPLPTDNTLTRAIFTRDLDAIRPPASWKLGRDGMVIGLPAATKTIELSMVH